MSQPDTADSLVKKLKETEQLKFYISEKNL